MCSKGRKSGGGESHTNNQNSTRHAATLALGVQKREVWHSLLDPASLFAFDSKSYNDIQALTKLRNEAATEGEKCGLEPCVVSVRVCVRTNTRPSAAWLR